MATSDYRRTIHDSGLRAKYLGKAFVQEIPTSELLTCYCLYQFLIWISGVVDSITFQSIRDYQTRRFILSECLDHHFQAFTEDTIIRLNNFAILAVFGNLPQGTIVIRQLRDKI